jgi:hypothetical protein
MGGQRTPPPPSRTGGSIASAFTGSLPRVRPDGGPLDDSDPNISSMPSYPPSYPPHGENATNGSMPAGGPPTGDPTVRWAPDRLDGPAHDDPPTHIQPLDQPDEQPAAMSLFGDAFAAQKAQNPPPPPPAPQPEVNRDLDAPTERLPIYEAVLSQWFEEGDGEKRTAAGERGRPSAAAEAPAARHEPPAAPPAPVAPPPPPPVHVEATNGNTPHVEYADHAEPAAVEPEPEPLPEPEPVEEPSRASAWQSPGDEGWQAAQALTKKKAPAVTTSAGLPKRVPKAQLIPGSAPSRPTSPQQQAQRSPALPPRSADAVRGRMSSFQQGIRRGRHAMVESYAGDQDSVESRQDEEQE